MRVLLRTCFSSPKLLLFVSEQAGECQHAFVCRLFLLTEATMTEWQLWSGGEGMDGRGRRKSCNLAVAQRRKWRLSGVCESDAPNE